MELLIDLHRFDLLYPTIEDLKDSKIYDFSIIKLID